MRNPVITEPPATATWTNHTFKGWKVIKYDNSRIEIQTGLGGQVVHVPAHIVDWFVATVQAAGAWRNDRHERIEHYATEFAEHLRHVQTGGEPSQHIFNQLIDEYFELVGHED